MNSEKQVLMGATQVTRGMRTRQILLLLKKHGRLTPEIIRHLLEPPIQRRRLQECLARLRRDKLVQLTQLPTPYGYTPYYQLHQKPYGRKRVAKVLGCTADDLHLPHFTSMYHDEGAALAYWHTRIEQTVANVKVYRKHEYVSFGLAKKLFEFEDNNEHRWPPLLIEYPVHDTFEKIYVGLIVEMNGYFHHRMMRKIKPMIKKSRLDALLFFDLGHDPREILNDWCADPLLQKYNRIKHYADNFLATSSIDFIMKINPPHVFTVGLGEVQISDWFKQLASLKSASIGPPSALVF